MKNLFFLFAAVILIAGCKTENNTTVTVVPLAPTNLSGTPISTTQIDLSWTDNATNEDGYKIERKIGNGNYAVIGSTGANISKFSDLGLAPKTAYTYRVYAFNNAGNSLQYSNEITVTTKEDMPSTITNGLVGFWPFNGNANDESGNGNNGTVNGATLTTDRFGNVNKAYSFDGASYIQANNWNSLIGNIPFSVSIWVKPSPSNNGWMLSFGDSQDGKAFEFGNWLWKGENLGVQIWKYNYIPNTITTTPFDIWTNITFVYSNNTIYAYKNGLLVATQNVNYTTTNLSAGIVSIGKQINFNEFFTGSLDDIRIWNRTLTQEEITYLASH